MLPVMSTPRLYIYIFLFVRLGEELELVGKGGGSQFFPIEEPCKEFLDDEVHNQNEATGSSVFVIFLKFCMEYCYHLTSFENG